MTASSQASGGRTPYDLSSVEHDYSAWEGPPRRTLLICTHPRSGSTLLGEALYFAGGLGCPLEYFHRGFRPGLAKRWQTLDLDTYVRAVHRFRTDPSGVLSVKLFWRDIEDMASESDPTRFANLRDMRPDEVSPDIYRDIRALLRDSFPNAAYAHLRRGDRVRQAVSSLTAVQTGLWRVIPQMGEQAPTGAAAYDFERIDGFIHYSDFCHGHWRNFFAVNGLAPLGLSYEELVGDYADTISRVLTYFGSNAPPPPARIRRQSGSINEEFVLRYLRDHRKRNLAL